MSSPTARRADHVAVVVAAAFRDGSWDAPVMAARAAHDLGLRPVGWLDDIAEWTVRAFRVRPDDARSSLVGFVAAAMVDDRWPDDDPCIGYVRRGDGRSGWVPPFPVTVLPAAMGTRRWPVRVVDTVDDLATMFNLRPNELAWYADTRSFERTVVGARLRHYDYRWSAKASGGARLVEAPKQNLKTFQRRILRDILDPIPPHDAAHGFRRGRSVHSFVEPHVGRHTLIRMDLRNFFVSIPAGRVFGIFRGAGYAEEVAHALTGLSTNAVPIDELRPQRGRADLRVLHQLGRPHLPQGAPTSPALANLTAFGLDRRLGALASEVGGSYTRYADDLAFSGPSRLGRSREALVDLVGRIVRDEGFAVNTRKTVVRDRSQRQILTGIVVNDHPNVPRPDVDRLRAQLHEARIHGPRRANRRNVEHFAEHLRGRISWVEAANPARGAALRAQFDAIDWTR